MKMKIFILFIPLLLFCGQEGFAQQANDVEILLPGPKKVKIFLPVELTKAEIYRDGGTITLAFRDRQGKVFEFSLDRSAAALPGADEENCPIYVSNTHPDIPQAVELPIGGDEERSILNLLNAWFNKNVTKYQKSKILNSETQMEFSEKEHQISYVMDVMEVLRNR